jgi:hypothetical protein
MIQCWESEIELDICSPIHLWKFSHFSSAIPMG